MKFGRVLWSCSWLCSWLVFYTTDLTSSVQLTSFTHTVKLDLPIFLCPGFVLWLWNTVPYRLWTRLAIASHFNSGALPSTTNTSRTPRRVKFSTRKKMFLRWGLLTLAFNPLAHWASQIQPLRSTHTVFPLKDDTLCSCFTGSRMLHSWLTPIGIRLRFDFHKFLQPSLWFGRHCIFNKLVPGRARDAYFPDPISFFVRYSKWRKKWGKESPRC